MPTIYTTAIALLAEGRQDVTSGSHTYQIRRLHRGELYLAGDLVDFLKLRTTVNGGGTLDQREQDRFDTYLGKLVALALTSVDVVVGGNDPRSDEQIHVRDFPQVDRDALQDPILQFAGAIP